MVMKESPLNTREALLAKRYPVYFAFTVEGSGTTDKLENDNQHNSDGCGLGNEQQAFYRPPNLDFDGLLRGLELPTGGF